MSYVVVYKNVRIIATGTQIIFSKITIPGRDPCYFFLAFLPPASMCLRLFLLTPKTPVAIFSI